MSEFNNTASNELRANCWTLYHLAMSAEPQICFGYIRTAISTFRISCMKAGLAEYDQTLDFAEFGAIQAWDEWSTGNDIGRGIAVETLNKAKSLLTPLAYDDRVCQAKQGAFNEVSPIIPAEKPKAVK